MHKPSQTEQLQPAKAQKPATSGYTASRPPSRKKIKHIIYK